jgi:sugar lactone lactonase YvrE
MSTRYVRWYFISLFETICSLCGNSANVRSCVQLGLLLLVLCGYGRASGVPVQLVSATIPAFPPTAVGSTSASQTVLLQLNSTLTISSITATPSQGGKQEYVLGTISGCTVDGTTTNASGCTVPITFQPAYAGNRGVSLQVVTSAGTFAFGLNGIGTGPQVALTPGTMVTVAGNGTAGYSGDNGAATKAGLNNPNGVAVDSAGNLYIADHANNAIRKVSAGTGSITTVVGNGAASSSATLYAPYGVAVDSAGNLYIADTYNNVVREVSAGTGIITTVAGNGTAGYSGDGGAATSAELNTPIGVAVDGAGNLYIADNTKSRVREVSAGTGIITTVAGNGTTGYSGDGGAATSAELNAPTGVAVDGAGDLYIVDFGNNRIRKVSAGTGNRIITTVAGSGTAGYSGDGGLATNAELLNPYGVAVDSAGDLYIADSTNNRIREVSAGTGFISTVAGNGTGGYSGDGGASTSAELSGPSGVALDSAGNLYIADSGNNRVREVEVTIPPTLTFKTATNVGSTDSVDGPQTITVSNIGNATLTLATPTTGMNPSVAVGFTLNNSSTCPQLGNASAAGMLASGTNCTYAVDFAPTVAGTISASLVLSDNALNAVAPNYAMQGIALSGTALQGKPTITWATPAAVPYATALSATQLDATASVPGTFIYNPAMGTVLGAGVQTLSVTFTPTDTTDYSTATAAVSLTVAAPTVPVLTFAPIATQAEGAAPFAVSATSASSGAVTYAVASGPATIAGNMVTVTGLGTVVLTANQTASGSYAPATATTTFVVGLPFTLATATSSGGSMNVSPGSEASFSFTLTPAAGTTFPNAVTFTATGLPTGATPTFSPATVAAGSGTTPVTVSIQTTNTQTARNEQPTSGNPLAPVALGFLLLPLLRTKAARRRLRQMPLPAVLLAVGLSLGAVLGISGCSSGAATPAATTPAAQTYTVVVAAMDSKTKVQTSINLTLTVQ